MYFANVKNMLKSSHLAFALCILYLVCNAFVLAFKPAFTFLYALLPLFLGFVYLLVFDFKLLAKLLVFCIPFSVTLSEMGLSKSTDLSIPTEPIMFAMLLFFIIHEFASGLIDIKILKHPLSLIIFAMLVWVLVSTCTSTIITVSLKNFIARLWFIAAGFLAGHILFKNGVAGMRVFSWLYIIPLSFIALYTLINHYFFGFNEDSADWVASPFYKDHTIYGACLAISFPVLIGFLFQRRYTAPVKIAISLLVLLHTTALLFSYTRAAWLSVVVALVVLLILLCKIKFKTLCVMALVLLTAALCFQKEIVLALSENKQDSEGNLTENVKSVTNISTDVSNLERINRWHCAMRMFEEKPLFGYGPGTYMFNYAAFQVKKEKTIISTDFADGGNAHSEYLGPLCEQGLPGALLMFALMITVVAYGFKLVYGISLYDDKIFIGSVFLGLITYFAHGFLNNYLDVDKAAVPFWGFIGMLVNYDVYFLSKQSGEKNQMVAGNEKQAEV